MKVFILGATGQTGSILTQKFIDKGYEVKIYIRNLEKANVTSDLLTVVEGSISDTDKLSEAMIGYDVVCSCLGGNANKKDYALTNLMKNVVHSAEKADVKRIVSISSAGIDNEIPGFIAKLFVNLFYKHAINDHKEAAKIIRSSNLNHTIIRPLSLTNDDFTGEYRVSESGIPKGATKISRRDLAHFMTDVILNDKYKNVSVCPAY